MDYQAGDRLYAVMVPQRWDGMTVSSTLFPVPLAFPPSLGEWFVPIFRTREEALEHYPNGPIAEVQAYEREGAAG